MLALILSILLLCGTAWADTTVTGSGYGVGTIIVDAPVSTGSIVSGSTQFLLQDEFDVAKAAGAVNGTKSLSGHTRTVTDTTNKMSISGGNLVFTGGTIVWGDPGLWYPLTTFVHGTMLIAAATPADNTHYFAIVADSTTNSSTPNFEWIYMETGFLTLFQGGIGNWRTGSTYTGGTKYYAALIRKTAGAMALTKAGAGGKWLLHFPMPNGAPGSLYPTIQSYDAAGTMDFFRIPSALWVPSPLVSDAFNNAFGTSDGLAYTAACPALGCGGAGVPWTQNDGTWVNSGATSRASALSGGKAIATVNLSTANQVIGSAMIRSAGAIGIVARYVDSNNYVDCYHDGTNVKCDEIVAGTPTNRISVVTAYGVNYRLHVIVDGATLIASYGQVLQGTATLSTLLTGTKVGMKSTDTNNTEAGFNSYARGTEGQYAYLDQFIN